MSDIMTRPYHIDIALIDGAYHCQIQPSTTWPIIFPTTTVRAELRDELTAFIAFVTGANPDAFHLNLYFVAQLPEVMS